MNLKTYIKDIRKITQQQAAQELGVSRVHLNNIINDKENASRQLALKIESWSNKTIRAFEVLKLNITIA